MNDPKKTFSAFILAFMMSLLLSFSVNPEYIPPEGASFISHSPQTVREVNSPEAKNTAVSAETNFFSDNLSAGKTTAPDGTEKRLVIPSGEAIGIKMYTEGLLVIYVTSFQNENGEEVSPAKNAGIEENDRIIAADGKEVKNLEEFSEYVNSSPGGLILTVARDDDIFYTEVIPSKGKDGQYMLGIWVRDSTAGIGTMTFYSPDTLSYAALGHAICDTDTGALMKISKGSLMKCHITGLNKGDLGEPGELTGIFYENEIGSIKENCEFGIYGELFASPAPHASPIPAASRFEVKKGDAAILCDIDGTGAKEYSAVITDVSKEPSPDNKGIVIEISDDELLQKTGGIVQGMSGSPIVQNGKLVGAVTHVFVNDPTRGYGIFIENMLAEAEKIK